jgi:hypothetical protein
MTLELRDPSNALLASITGASPGARISLPPTVLPSNGEYQLRLISTGITGYSLDAWLNASVERSLGDTADGDELAIDASLVALGTGRWAVVGQAERKIGYVQAHDPSRFIDISGTGIPLTLADDDEAIFDTTVGNELLPAGVITIANNGGVLARVGGNLYFQNLPLPAPDLGRALFPFWDDLGSSLSSVFVREQSVNGIDTLIVQWQDRPHFPAAGTATFQLQVFESGSVLARFSYLDVEFGDPRYDFGASATIGYQDSDQVGYEYSFGGADFVPPILPTHTVANGDFIDVMRVADVDEYTIDLSGQVGQSIDLVLSGIDGLDLSGQTLELLDPNGLVVATGSAQPLGIDATNYDLAILGFPLSSVGNNIYTVRVSSSVTGTYGLVVTEAMAFDTEPNASVANPLRQLTNDVAALGFLGPSDDQDTYQLAVNQGETVVVGARAPFSAPTATPLNNLGMSLEVVASSGVTVLGSATIAAGQSAQIVFVSTVTETVTIRVARLADASGEYLISASSDPSDFGDAPAPFATTLAGGGAVHGAVGPRLGALRDTELDGQPSAGASGDDANGADDEDGLTPTAVNIGQSNVAWDVNVQNAPSGAFLSAWIDFNGDGVWTPAEQIWSGVPVSDGTNPLTFNVPATATAGTHIARFRISSSPVAEPTGAVADGEVEDHPVVVQAVEGVVGRFVFYNNSFFDAANPSATPHDDAAIAPDKQALLPGQTATLANYTSYSRGINGIMIDVQNLADVGSISLDDFIFRVGNTADPSSWELAPAPSIVVIRLGEGVNGSDRIVVIWPDKAIFRKWLQVTVRATEATGLLVDDVHYWGNAIGETGNSPLNTFVNATDVILTRDNPHNFLDPAELDDAYDFNRDALVNATDVILARDNATNFLTALRLISV